MTARLRALLAFVAVVLVAAVATPATSVSAHAGLESSSPSANSVLESSPDSIVLDFDEPIDESVSSIELFDQERERIDVGDLTSSGDGSVIAATVPTLDDGLYAVVWRVTSADGHVIDGAFSFQIGAGDSGVDPGDLVNDVQSGSGADSIVGKAMTLARLLAFLGMIVLVGVLLFGTRSAAPQRARPLARWAAAVAVVGTLLAFGLYGAQVIGGGLSDAVSPAVWADIAGTRTGRALLIRAAGLAAVGVLVVMWQRRAQRWWLVGAASSLAVAVVATSVSGHASALSPQAVYVANSALHLVAVGAWVGGLLMLAVAGRAWFDEPSSEPLVRRFSTVALVAVPVMVVTGVVQAAGLIGGFDDLTASAWGRILLVKVTLVLVLVVLGGVGRWLLQHDGPPSLRRGVMVEAGIGLLVIGLTAGLVGEPPRAESSAQVFSTTITSGGVIADVTVTPGRVGANELHMVFTPPGGNLDPVLDVQARMSLPSLGVPNSPVTVQREGTNHYSGTITLPDPGAWTLEIIVTVAPASTVLLSTTVDIPG